MILFFILNSILLTEFKNLVAISSYDPSNLGCYVNPLYVHNRYKMPNNAKNAQYVL